MHSEIFTALASFDVYKNLHIKYKRSPKSLWGLRREQQLWNKEYIQNLYADLGLHSKDISSWWWVFVGSWRILTRQRAASCSSGEYLVLYDVCRRWFTREGVLSLWDMRTWSLGEAAVTASPARREEFAKPFSSALIVLVPAFPKEKRLSFWRLGKASSFSHWRFDVWSIVCWYAPSSQLGRVTPSGLADWNCLIILGRGLRMTSSPRLPLIGFQAT